MIRADYEMKKMTQGLRVVPGIESTLDAMIGAFEEGRQTAAMNVSSNRLWFEYSKDEKLQSPTFFEHGDLVWLDRCSVALTPRRQVASADGQLRDVEGDDVFAHGFAVQLTERFGSLAPAVPEFADLEVSSAWSPWHPRSSSEEVSNARAWVWFLSYRNIST